MFKKTIKYFEKLSQTTAKYTGGKKFWASFSIIVLIAFIGTLILGGSKHITVLYIFSTISMIIGMGIIILFGKDIVLRTHYAHTDDFLMELLFTFIIFPIMIVLSFPIILPIIKLYNWVNAKLSLNLTSRFLILVFCYLFGVTTYSLIIKTVFFS
jgi:hypothetical protein